MPLYSTIHYIQDEESIAAPKEKEIAAFHESGHAIVAKSVAHAYQHVRKLLSERRTVLGDLAYLLFDVKADHEAYFYSGGVNP